MVDPGTSLTPDISSPPSIAQPPIVEKFLSNEDFEF
jgi:hypothetical protein